MKHDDVKKDKKDDVKKDKKMVVGAVHKHEKKNCTRASR